MRSENEIKIRDKDIDARIINHNYGESLCHYTSISALYGIIQNQELWLGNTATMNDKSEIKYFIQKMQNAIQNDICLEKLNACDCFFDKVFKRIDNEYPFAISFSRLKDNAAQWERYADNANGVCIEFNTKRLMNLFYYSNGRLLFNEVFYEMNARKHKHYKILTDYFNSNQLNEFNSETGEIDNLIACAYLHKHESFCTESEVRLCNLWNYTIDESTISFELINGRIRKILKVSLDKLCIKEDIDFEDLIDRIVIGPRSEQNPKELQEYLYNCGLNKLAKKISLSECPLR